MAKAKKKKPTAKCVEWYALNDMLRACSLIQAKDALLAEQAGAARSSYLVRIQNRINRLVAAAATAEARASARTQARAERRAEKRVDYAKDKIRRRRARAVLAVEAAKHAQLTAAQEKGT